MDQTLVLEKANETPKPALRMKKFEIRELEQLKTTAVAFYIPGCGEPPIPA